MTNLSDFVIQVRRDILRMVHAVNSGHPGGSLGCAEFMVVLYQKIMKRNKDFTMDGENEDLFFLSNGHISPVFYSVLARSGYFPISELQTFRKINSRLQGHPTTHEGLPGVRIASGSLGQVCTIDNNNKQIDGDLKDVLDMGNLESKFDAFGWKVLTLEKGNDIEEVEKVLNEAKNLCFNEKPIVIIMNTEMGNGVDFMMGTHKWHGVAPNDEQLEKALNQNPETIKDY